MQANPFQICSLFWPYRLIFSTSCTIWSIEICILFYLKEKEKLWYITVNYTLIYTYHFKLLWYLITTLSYNLCFTLFFLTNIYIYIYIFSHFYLSPSNIFFPLLENEFLILNLNHCMWYKLCIMVKFFEVG